MSTLKTLVGLMAVLSVPGAEARTVGHMNSLGAVKPKPKIEQQSISFSVPGAKGTSSATEAAPDDAGFVTTKTQKGSVTTRAIGNPPEEFFTAVKKGSEATKGEGPKVGATATLTNDKDADGSAGGGGGGPAKLGNGNEDSAGNSRTISSIGLFAGTRPKISETQMLNVGPKEQYTTADGRPIRPQDIYNLPAGTQVRVLTPNGNVVTATTAAFTETTQLIDNGKNLRFQQFGTRDLYAGAPVYGLKMQPPASLRTMGIEDPAYYLTDNPNTTLATANDLWVFDARTGSPIGGGGGGAQAAQGGQGGATGGVVPGGNAVAAPAGAGR